MAFKDSDHTVMITVVCWTKLWLSLAVQLSGQTNEESDYVAMNAIIHWC